MRIIDFQFFFFPPPASAVTSGRLVGTLVPLSHIQCNNVCPNLANGYFYRQAPSSSLSSKEGALDIERILTPRPFHHLLRFIQPAASSPNFIRYQDSM